MCHVPISKTSPTPLFLRNNIKLNGIPSKQNYFFLFLGVLHQLLHQQIFSANFSELIQNYLEEHFVTKMSSKHLAPPPLQQQIAGATKVFYWCSLRWSFLLASTFKRYIFDEFLWSVLRKQNNHSSELNILSNSKEFREFLENLVRDLNANWFATYWWYSYSS